MCEITPSNRARIFGRLGRPKAEGEITVKKLGAKFAKTTTQGSKARRSYFTMKRVFQERGRCSMRFSRSKQRTRVLSFSSRFSRSAVSPRFSAELQPAGIEKTRCEILHFAANCVARRTNQSRSHALTLQIGRRVAGPVASALPRSGGIAILAASNWVMLAVGDTVRGFDPARRLVV